MKRLRICGALGVIAMVLVGATAASASATDFTLTDHGTALAKGAAGQLVYVLSGLGETSITCIKEDGFTLQKNGAPTDTLKGTGISRRAECSGEGASVTGTVKSAKVTVPDIKLSMKLVITLPGPCSYEVSKQEAPLESPPFASFRGTPIKNLLIKGGKNPVCKRTIEGQFEGGLENESGEMLEYELH
jgi:hypothetical protein